MPAQTKPVALPTYPVVEVSKAELISALTIIIKNQKG